METPTPDGIVPRPAAGNGRANPLPVMVLAAVMIAGLSGLLGGQPGVIQQVASDAAVLRVQTPETLRNGMAFETIVEVDPVTAIDDLVIGVSDGLWREMTINTMIPAPAEETFKDGYQRFSFGPFAAGEALRFKIDGQINPPLFAGRSGEIAVMDGERMLTGVPIRVRVLP